MTATKDNLFQTVTPVIEKNSALREPQKLAYAALVNHDFDAEDGREVGIVLPVGCGKSGLLAIAPFALSSRRTLLIAPNLNIAKQLLDDLTPTDPDYFYSKRGVVGGRPYPEVAEIRGTKTNMTDLDDADIVVTNIHQLQRDGNKWLAGFDPDYFDLIQFDEAHHNVAESWDVLREKFPNARIINVSATPSRADGRLMAGQIIYVYPISQAVKNGYVKRISGHRLSPKSLRYVRREGEEEVTVELDEVRRLGETDANFRRSIVSSEETLSTIVDASINKLNQRRKVTGENRLKIIASALNMEHCKQIVAAYSARGLRADFVHSKQDSKANERVHKKLDNHELDVIVQVRKLGEGFDHPFLTVAAVFSIFSNLSPFMQFVGRVMRIIPDSDPHSELNEGIVVFHVGGNITGVWNDFRDFADADQEFLMNLVDEDLVEPEGTGTGEGGPRGADAEPIPVITAQEDVQLESIELLSNDPNIAQALKVLQDAGVTTEQYERLNRLTPSRQAQRQADRKQLDEQVKTIAGSLLASHGLSHVGRDLDKSRRRENFVTAKSELDKEIKKHIGSKKPRSEYSAAELTDVLSSLDKIRASVEARLFNE
ncbi:DEAD/DEAH box helicase family protein [Mycobacterium sp. 236(2023)]|uniref:DEAD/DEAH box helicase n=1 Tax=Mycobacterium sp. 236(2023) TaxID=3038163 RepID=UPI0024153455|nr:DEAD/DEAH box helicase family protein [Mycobacterium sp. 236(2023)]MDG4668616.1 DEAD/DEAH box helicase family protein [Mycobacterium sp. 236(2023)]